MPIISDALYAGKNSLRQSSRTETETIDRIAGYVTEKRWLFVDEAERKPHVNTGKAKEQNGKLIKQPGGSSAKLLKLSSGLNRHNFKY